MIVKNVQCTLYSVNKKAGKSKATGKDYAFVTATLIDERADKFVVTVNEALEEIVKDFIDNSEFEPKKAIVSLELYPKGYDFGARMTDIEF